MGSQPITGRPVTSEPVRFGQESCWSSSSLSPDVKQPPPTRPKQPAFRPESSTSSSAPSTTQPPTTTTSEPPVDLASLTHPEYAFGTRYGVIRIPAGDPDGGLVMREEPSASSAQVAVLDPSTTNVFAEQQDGDWWFVSSGNFGGWVNSFYLTPLATDLACDPNPNAYDLDMNGVSDFPQDQVGEQADFLMSVHRYEVDGCSRVVLTFGADAEEAEPGVFSQNSPPIEATGLAVHTVTFDVGYNLTEAYSGDVPYAFVVNDDGQQRYLVIHNNQNRLGRITWLQNPGQIVIDSISAPTGTGLDLGPVLPDPGSNGAIVFANAFNTDLNGVAPYEFSMTGYGRPFEADFGAFIVKDGKTVDATFEVTDLFSGTTTIYEQVAIVPATNWLTAWGRFEFSFEIPTESGPGLYTLVTSEGAVEDGAEFTFCVGAVTSDGCS